MEMERAVITEQDETFSIIKVNRGTLKDAALADALRESTEQAWGMSVVYMETRADGKIDFRGRPDLVRFLFTADLSLLQWERRKFDPFTQVVT